MNEQQFAQLIQQNSQGLLTQTQANTIANNVSRELQTTGKVSPQQFQAILNRHLHNEVGASIKSVTQSKVIQDIIKDAQKRQPEIIERTPSWAESLLLTEVEKQERDRDTKINDALEILGVSLVETNPTRAELKAEAQNSRIETLRTQLKKWSFILRAVKGYGAQIHKKMEQHAAEYKTEENKEKARAIWHQSYDEKIKTVETAIPFVEENVKVLEEALNVHLKELENKKVEVEKALEDAHRLAEKAPKLIQKLEPLGLELRRKPSKKVAEKIQKVLDEYEAFKTQFETTLNPIIPFAEDLHFALPDFPSIPVGTLDKSTLKVALTGHWG